LNYPPPRVTGSALRCDKQRGINRNILYRPKGRGIKTLSAAGGLVRRRIEKESQPFKNGWLYTAFKNKFPSSYATGPPPPIILFESSV